MISPKFYQKFSDSILLPQIIKLESNLYIIAFRLMKLIPAKYIISEAIKRKDIQQNSIIVDTSSGTFALGLGIICCELGLKFKIFGDPAIDKNLLTILEDLGGSVHRVKTAANKGAYQKQRLKALHSFISRTNLSFWTKQYDNLDNRKSYSIVSDLLISTLGKNINIVGTVGSGGSTCGIISKIREENCEAKLIGVDTFNSVLFGQPDGKRDLRGLGNTIIPSNLDHSLYDEVHWVSANDAIFFTRLLHKELALFYGPTTGAALQVAKYLANKNKKEIYAFIAPDEGYRYLKTAYNDSWLKKQSFYSSSITKEPREVTSPLEAVPPWSFINWNRRPYESVIKK